MSSFFNVLLAASMLMVVIPQGLFAMDRSPAGLNFNPRDIKAISAAAQKRKSMLLGCPGLETADANITCKHERLENKLGQGIDCTEKVPVHTKAYFLNCPPGYGLVEEYQIINCKFPGKWDNDVFTCEEKPTEAAKPTTKAANTTTTTKKPTTTLKLTTKPSNITTKPSNTTTTTPSSNSTTSLTLATITVSTASTTTATPSNNGSTTSIPTTVATAATNTTTTATTTTNTVTTTSPAATTTTTAAVAMVNTATTTVAPVITAPTDINTAATSTTQATSSSAGTSTAATTTTTSTTTITTSTTTTPAPKPPPYEKVDNVGHIKRGSIPKNWADAVADCSADGANLLSVDTDAKRDLFMTFTSNPVVFEGASNKKDIWTGVVWNKTDWFNSQGVAVNSLPLFKWIDGRPQRWSDYTVFSRETQAHWDVFAVEILRKSPYICEKP